MITATEARQLLEQKIEQVLTTEVPALLAAIEPIIRDAARQGRANVSYNASQFTDAAILEALKVLGRQGFNSTYDPDFNKAPGDKFGGSIVDFNWKCLTISW